jgi:hypothetical protein
MTKLKAITIGLSNKGEYVMKRYNYEAIETIISFLQKSKNAG